MVISTAKIRQNPDTAKINLVGWIFLCIFASSFSRNDRTYRKDVVTAFYLRRRELRNFTGSAITQCSSSMGWHTSVLLYTISVGFGIVYSEPKAMRRPSTRDKQSSRFPRFFCVLNKHEPNECLGITFQKKDT